MVDDGLVSGRQPLVNVGTAQRPKIRRAKGLWSVPFPRGGYVRLTDHPDPEQKRCEILAECGLLLEAFDELGISWEEAVERKYCNSMATSRELWTLALLEGKKELAGRIREFLAFQTGTGDRPPGWELLVQRHRAKNGVADSGEAAAASELARPERRKRVANGFQQVVVLGNLVKDAEVAYLGEKKTSRLSMRVLACTGFKESEHCEAFCVELWGSRGEALSPYLVKGTRVLVTGTMRTRQYEQNGETRYFTAMRADSITLQPAGIAEPPSEDESAGEIET